MKIISSGRRIDHTLTYRDVRFDRREVGRIPNDIFLPTSQTPPLDTLKKSRPVMVNQPEMKNGEVNVREISERFQASAPSPLVGGLVGGFVGGVTGSILGGFASLFSGHGAFLVGAGALGIAGGAYLGARNAASKEVQLVVRERPILSQSMTGIETRVSQGHLKGKSGFFHHFSGQLEATNHGTYDVPVIQTVRKGRS
jgi:hypothetical protein